MIPPPAAVASVVVSPQDTLLEQGTGLQLVAVLLDSAGNALTDRQVTWLTSDPDVAVVTAQGLVETVGLGEASISAESEGKTGAASLTVVHAPVTLVGAGDIADCATPWDDSTASLLDGIDGTIFAAGDVVYEDGTAWEFATCYEPTWGRHKDRTRPAVGNHEYHTTGAVPYFDYFGPAAGDPGKGWYSYELGAWKIIVLNSNATRVGVGAGSEQEQWLRQELAGSRHACTVAYWHHPRFSSGLHGDDDQFDAFWQALYEHGADVVLVGHDHHYERFAPLNPAGVVDTSQGIRQFIVGTGGRLLRPVLLPRSGSEVIDIATFGVLSLTLRYDSYEWEFVPVAGQEFTDSGAADCH